jgi:gluconolactonase
MKLMLRVTALIIALLCAAFALRSGAAPKGEAERQNEWRLERRRTQNWHAIERLARQMPGQAEEIRRYGRQLWSPDLKTTADAIRYFGRLKAGSLLALALRRQEDEVRTLLVSTLGELGDDTFAYDLIFTLYDSNNVVPGGAEAERTRRELKRALLKALARLTPIDFGEVDLTALNSRESLLKIEEIGKETEAWLKEHIVPRAARVEKVAGGFQFAGGLVWTRDGYLLFSDVPNNAILKWNPEAYEKEVSDFRRPSGHTSGMTLDRNGRLLCCEQSARRVSRREFDGTYTTVVDRYEGKRLNGPTDVVFSRDGATYFTDSSFRLAKGDDDPAKELPHSGVYRFKDGKLTLLIKDLKRPSGLAFSIHDKILYVANADPARKVWMAYPVKPDGTLEDGKLFFDATESKEAGLPGGMRRDSRDNLYCTGPGGVRIFSPAGKHLDTIKAPEVPTNCTWGDDGRSLYIASPTSLYRIRLNAFGNTR